LTLYLVTAANEDGENLDLFVEAGSADAAAQMLVDHWAADEVEVAGDVIVYEVPTSARPGVVDCVALPLLPSGPTRRTGGSKPPTWRRLSGSLILHLRQGVPQVRCANPYL
jgi:hypothetical protein